MESNQLVVIGGGPAGASAAIQAPDLGLGVTLTDENPVDFAMMGLDIPYYYGQRMMPSLRDKGLIGYGECIPLGPAYMPAYAEGVRSGLRELAPGTRDLVLGFPGRELVGVMGANAVVSLLGPPGKGNGSAYLHHSLRPICGGLPHLEGPVPGNSRGDGGKRRSGRHHQGRRHGHPPPRRRTPAQALVRSTAP